MDSGNSLELTAGEDRKWTTLRKIGIAIVAGAAIWIGILLIRYILIAGFRIPIMDYYRWIAWYGEKIHTGAMSVADFFTDKNEQIQPLSLIITFGILDAQAYETWPLVIIGSILRILIFAGLAFIVLFQWKKAIGHITLFIAVCSFAVIMIGLNPNQWELTIEPFSLTTSLRLLCFIGYFIWSEKVFRQLFDQPFRMQLIEILLLALVAAGISLLLSGAYFVGFLGAVSLNILFQLFIHRKQLNRNYIILAAIWGAMGAGCLIAYMNLMGDGGSVHGGKPLMEYIRGLLAYLGASVYPQNIAENISLTPFIIIGGLMIAYAVFLLTMYIKKKYYQTNTLPIILILYALLTGIIIALGRVQYYGAGTMASSRYVTEAIFFPIGLVILSIPVFEEKAGQNIQRIVCKGICFVSVAAMILGTGYCFKEELRLAPYRAAYQNQMRAMMTHLDDYSDAELGIFQEEPQNIRETVRFFQKYNLSIFKDIPYEEHSKEKDTATVHDVPDVEIMEGYYSRDKWASPTVKLRVQTGPEGDLVIHCWCPEDLQEDAKVFVFVEDSIISSASACSGSFDIHARLNPNQTSEVVLSANYNVNVQPPEERVLSYLILDIECK